MQPIKVAILTNRIPPYRRPIFETLCQDKSYLLKIFLSMPIEFSKNSADTLPLFYSRSIGVKKTSQHASVKTRQEELFSLPLSLFFDLMGYRPDIIISGEFGLRSLVAYIVSRLRRIPLAVWSEEIKETARGRSSLQNALRKFLIPRIDVFLAWGHPAVEYLLSWNIEKSKIYYCSQAVDNNFFMKAAATHEKRKIKLELELRGKVFLTVGRLVALKGFDYFLNAWASLPTEVKEQNSVLIVGAGEEEEALRGIAIKENIPNIVFAGHKEQSELPIYYAASDIFVFPSLVDVWGLVVNEAMASGLPVLASKYAGASQGLIDGSGAGEVFDPLNVPEFAATLYKWSEQKINIPAELPQAIVSHHNFSVTVKAVKRLIKEVSRRKKINKIL